MPTLSRIVAALASSIALLSAAGCIRDERDISPQQRAAPVKTPVQAPSKGSGTLGRIERVLAKIERLDLGVYAISREDGEMLRMLVQAVDAQQVVEIGTGTGYSGLWLCSGLEETGGRLRTYEIDADHARLAGEHFREAGVEQRVTIVVGDAHQKVASFEGTIDLLFFDAEPQGNVDYLRQLLPKVRENGLIVAHNMYRPPPDPRYVTAVTSDPTLHTIFLPMDGRGLGVSQKRGTRPSTTPDGGLPAR